MLFQILFSNIKTTFKVADILALIIAAMVVLMYMRIL
jgi:hypothetical protein